MKAHITNFGIENFRVFKNKTQFEFAPITILTGTNSSGKSSLINAMEIFNSEKSNKEESNDNFFWRVKIPGFINKKLSFNNFILETSIINKRFGRFDTFFSSKDKNNLILYSFYSRFDFFQSLVEVELGYGIEGKDKSVGILKQIVITDVDSNCKIVVIKANGKNVIVEIVYKYFFDKLNEYLNNNEKNNGVEVLSTDTSDSLSFFGDKIVEKAKIKEMFNNNNPFYKYGFGPINKVRFQSKLNKKFENYQAFDADLIDAKKKEFLEKYPQLSNDVEKKYFMSQQEMSYLSTFMFYFENAELGQSSLKEILKIISNPISENKNQLNLDSHISELKEIKYSKITLNEEFKAELEFIFNEFITGNIIKIINNASLPTFEKINTARVNIQRSYSDIDLMDKNSFSSKIRKIVKILSDPINPINESVISFINSSLNTLHIADKIEIVDGADHSSYLVYLIKSGKKTLLADAGYGVSQVLSIIFSIADKINGAMDVLANMGEFGHPESNFTHQTEFHNLTIIIEEPEASLHPANQSKLADIFIKVAKRTGIRFIIETHSEYLIRKLQYLTAKGELKPEDTVIYYFYPPDDVPPGEEQVKKINITEDGSLTDDFGSGFFDEADNLAIDLYTLLTNNRKN